MTESVGTAIVMASIGVAGCLGFAAVGRARRSRYALALALAFAALAGLIGVIVAGGYVDCTKRDACPTGIGVIKVAYFGMLAAILLMLLGGLGVLSRVPAAREGGLNRDLGLTGRIVAVAALAGLLYLVLGFIFAVMLAAAVAEARWGAFAVIFIFGAVPTLLVGYQAMNAERLALRAARARVMRPGQEPHLHELVTRLAMTADLPVPRVAVARSSEANAFSVGLTPGRSAIVVTSELLRRLDDGQLKAVIAHELSHIANRDGAVMTLISAPTMFGSLWLRLPRQAWVAFWFYLPLWFVGLLLLWSMSRAREFYADRGSAQLTGAPEQLMSALVLLGGKNATRDLRGMAMQALCIVRPGHRRWYELSHPSIDRRIARLEALTRQLAHPR